MGVLVGIYDLGEQGHDYKHTGKLKFSRDLAFTFEISGETVEVDGEEKPRELTKTMTASFSKNSKLRKFIDSWTAHKMSDAEMKDFDTAILLGKAAMITVLLSEDGQYSNIDAVTGLPKGVPVPQTSTVPVEFDMDAWDDDKFKALPEWVQDKITDSPTYAKLHAPEDVVDFPDAQNPQQAATAAQDTQKARASTQGAHNPKASPAAVNPAPAAITAQVPASPVTVTGFAPENDSTEECPF
jgi:hypothetical protein